MSKTIDERVVQMQFDNRQFEKGAAESMSTIDKLKQKLNFSGATKGLEDVGSAAKKVDMSGISGAVETVKNKFSAMEIVGVTALANITNSAVNYGKRMLAALTIDPVKSGFGEFELKMGSIQTIMASTGESLETVNKYLEELNEYSDKTIYSFSDMTNNIGKFTNAGVKLEDAVAAIKGVSNVAAVAGANSNEASRAMYNFSQALSAGYVKLIDWKSIENANMANVEFKNQLIETAVALGTLRKSADGTYKTLGGTVMSATKNFNETLQEQWMTTDVLTKTLNKYADETTDIGKKATDAATKIKTFSMLMDTLKEGVQSGWATTWETVFGNFEEGIELWTKVNDEIGGILGKIAENRNNLLKEWKELGGRDDLMQGIANIWGALKNIVEPIRNAFRDIFPPMTAKRLKEITEAFKNFTAKLKLGEGTMNNIKRTFKGLFAILNLVWQAIKAVFKVLSPLVGSFFDLSGGLFAATASLGDWLTKLSETAEKTEFFAKILQKIANVFRKLAGYIKTGFLAAFDFVKRMFSGLYESCSPYIDRLKEAFGVLFESIKETFRDSTDLKDFFGRLGKSFKTFFKAVDFAGIIDALKNFKNSASDSFQTVGDKLDWLKDKLVDFVKMAFKFLGDNFGEIFAGGLGLGTVSFFNKIGRALTLLAEPLEALGDIGNATAKFIKQAGKAIRDLSKGFKAMSSGVKFWLVAQGIQAIAFSLVLLAGALIALTFINPEKLKSAVEAMLLMMAGLVVVIGVIGLFDKIGSGFYKAAFSIAALAVAMTIISTCLHKLNDVNTDGLIKKVLALSLALVGLSAAAVLVTRYGKGFLKNAVTVVAFAYAIKILADAVVKVSNISDIKQAAVGVALLLSVVVALAAISMLATQTRFRGFAAILMMAGSLLILAIAFEKIADVSLEKAKENFANYIVVFGLFGALCYAATKITKYAGGARKGFLRVGVTILALGAAMILISAAVKILANMSLEELSRGTKAAAALMLTFGAVVKLSKYAGKHAAKAGVMLALMTIPMVILTGLMYVLGKLDTTGIGVGMACIAGISAMFAGLIAVTKLYKPSVNKAIISFTIGVGVLSAMAIAMSFIKPHKLFAAVGALTVLVGALAGAILAISKVKSIAKTTRSTLLMISIAVGLLGGLVIALSVIDSTAALKSAISIALVIGALGGALVLVGKVKKVVKTVRTTLLELGAITIILSGMVYALAMIMPETALNNAVTLGVLLAAITGSLAILTHYKVVLTSSVGAVAIMAAILVALGGALWLLVDLPVDKVVPIAFTLSAVLLAITGALAIMSLCKVNLTWGLAAVAIMGVIFLGLGGALWLIGKMDIGKVMPIALQLSGLLVLLTGVLGVLTVIGLGGPAALIGVGSLTVLIYALTVVMLQIGALFTHLDVLEGVLDTGMRILGKLGLGLGEFVGNFVGGVITTVSNALPKVGDNLSKFMEGASVFIDGLNKIKPSTLVAMGALVGMLIAITAMELVNGILRLFGATVSLESFGDELCKFGPKIVEFAKTVEGLKTKNVEAAAASGKILAEFARAIPNEGGLLGKIMGENSLSKFGEELVLFGPQLMKFATSIEGIEVDDIKKSAAAGTVLAEFAKAIPNQGGILAELAGDNSLSTFGEELVKFGPNLMKYAESVRGIDPSETGDIAKSAAAGEILSKLANGLPSYGGKLKEWFVGGKVDMATFGEQIASFGEALKNYSASMKFVDVDLINHTSAAVTSLSTLAKQLPKYTWYENEAHLDEFAEELTDFAEELREFNKELSPVNPVLLDAVVTQMFRLVALARDANGLDTSGLNNFSNTLANLGKTGMSKFLESFNQCVAQVTNMVALAIDSFSNAVTAKQASIATTFVNLFSVGSTTAANIGSKYWSIGAQSMTNFANGLSSRRMVVIVAVNVIAIAALTVIKGKYEDFKSAGKYVVQGFANGISENEFMAAAKAKAMAESALRAARKALDEHSPSKAAYKIGAYAGQGFVNALDDYVIRSYKAGSEVAESATDGLTSSIVRIADIIDGNIDTQPTIRPVLDLSEVEAGARRLTVLFGSNHAIKVGSEIANANESAIQNGGKSPKAGNTYQFIQNNNSPKPLSRIEIYRQTNNQFSAFERTVNSRD